MCEDYSNLKIKDTNQTTNPDLKSKALFNVNRVQFDFCNRFCLYGIYSLNTRIKRKKKKLSKING